MAFINFIEALSSHINIAQDLAEIDAILSKLITIGEQLVSSASSSNQSNSSSVAPGK